MIGNHTLPAIVYGLGPDGFTILNVSPCFPSGARKDFLNFARSVSWRPAKIEVPDAIVISLIPSPNGAIVARLSQQEADAYGRELAMRIEGIYCRNNDYSWHRLTVPDAWPINPILDPCELIATEMNDVGLNVAIDWEPSLGHPLILASRKLINAPVSWFTA